ncbi:phage shock protein C [Methanomicrobium sp. W14]|uniref:PspC domain-containing protein n=1 Tax=Methanomicrobium sp. W14 TaxID=2817839 RepID=UPI001AE77A59|nr:PspC domain-containing protein [Methanomicrobium sp. W14]MBP2132926.1 phage shock protein C [Methanomicrobium sp. W14]
MKKLYRSKDDRVIAGICGGLGRSLDVDPNILRILWVLFCFAYGLGIIAYIVSWVFLPEEEEAGVIDAEYVIKDKEE